MSMIYLYGDSLLKATMPDESFRYHFHLDQLSSRYAGSPLTMVNRSKMGATVAKGQSLLAHDLQREMPAQMALIGYGGNDCDFCWQQIAENPDGEHHPHTELNTYLQALVRMAKDLLSRGIQPVLMTLPPIDARRYLDFICRNGLNRERIMHWLGEEQMIYRHQELYSDAVAQLARQQDLPLIPVREAFLTERHLQSLIAADGIHLTMRGYERLFDTLYNWFSVCPAPKCEAAG
ncbi:MAG: SGNH/GDSL hydrolase family protein [Ruminococcaceae bacterium]|nr:SGNH/GDSL hydrolase family protein [Oscillospiraceae bacterium]